MNIHASANHGTAASVAQAAIQATVANLTYERPARAVASDWRGKRFSDTGERSDTAPGDTKLACQAAAYSVLSHTCIGVVLLSDDADMGGQADQQNELHLSV